MNRLRLLPATLAAAITLSFPTLTAAAEAARPAFEAHSELFELVGRIKDERLTLTLDRWASNEPVSGARIEIEVDGKTLLAEAQPDGSYALGAAPFATPATYPLTILIDAGDESDLLAADFVVAADTEETAAGETGITGKTAIAAALASLVVIGAALIRHHRRGEHA